jgi:integrase
MERLDSAPRFHVVPTAGSLAYAERNCGKRKPMHKPARRAVAACATVREPSLIVRKESTNASRDALVQGVTDAALAGDAKALARATSLLLAYDETAKGERRPRKSAKRPEVKTITRGEYERIIAAIDTRYPSGVRNRAIFALLWHTGARIGEVLHARVDAIDTETHEFAIPNSGKRGARRVALPRGAAWDELNATLLEWASIREPDATYLFTTMHDNTRHKKGDAPRTGKIENSAVERTLNLYAARAGVKKVNPHMLRHSWATSALRNGWTLADVARQLGDSPAITAKFYAHSDTRRLHELQERDAERAGDGPIPF